MSGWQWLDLIAKTAGVGGIWIGYRQFKRNAEYHKKSVQREAVRLAAEQAKEFGCVIIPRVEDLRKRIDEAGCAYFKKCKVMMNEKEIRVDYSAVGQDEVAKLKDFQKETVDILNRIEAFAIYFATNVADDNIGFIECGPAFIGLFESNFPLFGRHDLRSYYRCSQAVYWRWKKRIGNQGLADDFQKLQDQAIVILRKLLSNDIKPRDPLGS
jgi:hypothetical protein